MNTALDANKFNAELTVVFPHQKLPSGGMFTLKALGVFDEEDYAEWVECVENHLDQYPADWEVSYTFRKV